MKCFGLPAIRTCGTLLEEKNVFNNGWTFSNFHFKLISGTEFMLKKVLLEECIFTIYLLTCLCLLTKLAATIMEFSVIWSSSFGEKNFLPLTPSRWIWQAPRKGLFRKGFLESVKISLVSLFDFIVSAMWFLNFFPNNSLSCFCKRAAFSFSIVFTWYCEFMIHSKTFNLLWYVMALLLCPRSNTICST